MHAFFIIENGETIRAENARMSVPWCSFTKLVMAAAVLRLVEQQKLDLDAPLAPDYTLRQLLQHRAGLTDYGELPAYRQAVKRGEDAWPVEELLIRCEASRLRFTPGTRFFYSNIGYWWVRRHIEIASGEPLGNALRLLVIDPLGLRDVRFAKTRADLDGVMVDDAANYDPGWVYHGLLVGTLESTVLLLQRLLSGALLSQRMLDEMRDAIALPGHERAPWIRVGYGLGMMVGTTAKGLTTYGHTGGGLGSVAVYADASDASKRVAAAWYPENDVTNAEAAAIAAFR
jgi:CubicO group peptidase (beta-lactamase class C family)